MKKTLILIIVGILCIGVLFSGCLNKDFGDSTDYEYAGTVSYPEFHADYDFDNYVFESYKEKDLVEVRDIVFFVEYYEDMDPSATAVYLHNESAIPFIFIGDKIDEYTIGEIVTISAHIKSYNVEGQELIMPEEWYYYWLAGVVPNPTILFDQGENILLVRSIDSTGLFWEDMQIIGTATLPTGSINAGDKITDCSGTVTIVYVPTNSIIGEFIFE